VDFPVTVKYRDPRLRPHWPSWPAWYDRLADPLGPLTSPDVTVSFNQDQVYHTARFTDGTGSFDYRQFMTMASRWHGRTTGQRTLTVRVFQPLAGVYAQYQVDGGAWQDVVPAAINAQTTATLNLGSSAPHTVVLRAAGGPGLFYLIRAADTFLGTGPAPTLVADPAQTGTQYFPGETNPVGPYSSPGIASHQRLESDMAVAANGSFGGNLIQIGTVGQGETGGEWANQVGGGLDRVAGKPVEIDLLVLCDGISSFVCWTDSGTPVLVTTPDRGGDWDWLMVKTGGDTGAEHEYALQVSNYDPAKLNFGAAGIAAVRTRGGTGINTATRPAVRNYVIVCADSIGENNGFEGFGQPIDMSRSWIFRWAMAKDWAVVVRGISSTTTLDTRPGFSGSPYCNGASGQARTNHDVTAVVAALGEPLRVYLESGTNDAAQVISGSFGGPAETTAQYQTATQAYCQAALDATTTAAVVKLGILDRNDAIDLTDWRAKESAGVAAVGSGRCTYLPWGSVGLVPADYADSVHPKGTGHVKMANRLIAIT
jgi:hypothetical protein